MSTPVFSQRVMLVLPFVSGSWETSGGVDWKPQLLGPSQGGPHAWPCDGLAYCMLSVLARNSGGSGRRNFKVQVGTEKVLQEGTQQSGGFLRAKLQTKALAIAGSPSTSISKLIPTQHRTYFANSYWFISSYLNLGLSYPSWLSVWHYPGRLLPRAGAWTDRSSRTLIAPTNGASRNTLFLRRVEK